MKKKGVFAPLSPATAMCVFGAGQSESGEGDVTLDFLFYLILQKHIVKGMVAGAIKA